MKKLLSLSLLFVVVVITGCKAEGTKFDCTCTFSTDFDDNSKRMTKVCAQTAEKAKSIGKGCVQSEAVTPVQDCACEAVKEEPATCKPVGCLKKE